MCLLPSLKWISTVSFLGIVQWDFTRRDHPGNPGRVSGSGPVTHIVSTLFVCNQVSKLYGFFYFGISTLFYSIKCLNFFFFYFVVSILFLFNQVFELLIFV